MKILITGNMGYIGPILVRHLKQVYPETEIIGYDIGYFANCLTNAAVLPEVYVDTQVFGDIRDFPEHLLEGVDAVVNLAAISNDPMGKKFEEITMDINHRSGIKLANMAKNAGVKHFVFASSCSMYGAADDFPKTESSQLNPLTAYAKSKVYSERDLKPLADENFVITCLRFGTACGFSPRLRLDLVLNDFVAGALVLKEISILSDGTPWRPMINIKDMARAIEWAAFRESKNGGAFVAVNTGTNKWNNQVKTIADAVGRGIPGTRISINKDAPVDKRSFKVNFDLFKKLAPDHQPIYNLEDTVAEMKEGITAMGLNDPHFRESQLIRLKVLNKLQDEGLLNEKLEWVSL